MATPSTAIRNVRVFDGTGLTGLTTVLLRDGRIAGGQPAEAPDFTIDGRGGTLLPGLIDAHVHVDGVRSLQAAAHWGVTTMLDMGTPSPELIDPLRGLPGLTDIRSSLAPASAPGGLQTTHMGMPPSSAVAGPEDAPRFVAERAAEGADYLKIIVEDPALLGDAALSGPTIAAIVQAAHASHLRVVAHVTSVPAFELAAGARVDILTHAPLDAPLSAGLLRRIAAAGLLSVPTLTMMRGVAAGPRVPTHAAELSYHNAEISVTGIRHAGIPIIAGTDANTKPGSPFQQPHGEALHQELALLVAAGLTPVEALRAATIVAVTHFDLPDRGAIQPGLRADLILVEGDPTTDIAATRAIQGVWIAGARVR